MDAYLSGKRVKVTDTDLLGEGGEARVYRIANGRGYATLLAHDDSRNALLLERLGRPIAELGLSVNAQLEHIGATLRTAWISPNDADGLMTGAEKSALARRVHRRNRICVEGAV